MPPINYHRDLGYQRCRDILAAKRDHNCTVDPILNCWTFNGSRNTDGYGQIWAKKNQDLNRQGRASQTAFLLHVIALQYKTGNNPIPAGHQASHICDNRGCFNPDHLVAERPQVNNSRKGCVGPVFCPDHGHELINLCAHSPQCIRRPNENATCCLTLRREPGWNNLPSSTRTRSSGAASSSQAPTVSPYFAASAVSQQRGATASPALDNFQRGSSAVSSRYSGASAVEEALRNGEL